MTRGGDLSMHGAVSVITREAAAERLRRLASTVALHPALQFVPDDRGRAHRLCPWHLLNLGVENDELRCRVGTGEHSPNVWLVADARGRILGAGWACEAEPAAVLLDPPLPLEEYVRTVWLSLRWARKMFGHGSQKLRIPVAVRRAIVERVRYSATPRDARVQHEHDGPRPRSRLRRDQSR